MGDKNNKVLIGYLQTLQNKVAKVILGSPIRSSTTEAKKILGFKLLSCRQKFRRLASTVYINV